MKLLIALLLLPALSLAQEVTVMIPAPYQPKHTALKHAALISAGIIAGIADGQMHVVMYAPLAYGDRHPNANEQWWNPVLSSRNKYRNNDPTQGPKFPLSTTMLVGLTDKQHLNQMIRTTMFSIQMGLVCSLTLDEFKKKGKLRAGKIVLYVLEAQIPYWLAKGATHRYYDIY